MEQNIKQLVTKQREFHRTGATYPLKFRVEQLQKLEKGINDYEEEILEALQVDLGKAPIEAYSSEVGFVMGELRQMIRKLPRHMKVEKVKTPIGYFGAKSYIYNDPLGLVLIMGPWNYPFQLIIGPLIGAMAAGNCCILKPSEYAPHVSAVIQKIITANFSEEYIAVIEGGIPVSSALLAERYDHIFFTGGAEVGRIVMQAAARNLTPVTLELGGKSPCIVDSSSNLEQAARRVCWGKFLNSGQTCVAPDYLLVHSSIKDAFVKQLIQMVQEFYGSNPFESLDYGRIINDTHFQRLEGYLQEGRILLGGDCKREAKYISPTIIDQVSLDSVLMQEEIFGPILPVLEYNDLDEAIELINSKAKPLALYFFSADAKKQEHILRETSSGSVCINDTLSQITTQYLPFGGVGESGMGQYHGKASFDIFVHKKSVLKANYMIDVKAKYPPYKISLNQIKRLMKFI
ncbi:MAG TPA: aldehyde dehydrogenase [Syntrophomonadaceae bacterium]|nr:aldehyde dehydrogenase [Syntrophomonadaceae bacterium]